MATRKPAPEAPCSTKTLSSDVLAHRVIEWRRELHQFPELSEQEYQTTQRITRWLSQLSISPLPITLKTGLVADIGASSGPVVALRADIDALPIVEDTDVPFRSQHSGVMHACGHDFHTAVMLGAAGLLKAREAQLPGRVRLLFQPAEEVSGFRWCTITDSRRRVTAGLRRVWLTQRTGVTERHVCHALGGLLR